MPMPPGPTARMLQRALSLWVRTTVLPTLPRSLKLDPDTPVCYVLPEEHLSDRFILCEEIQRAGLPPAISPLETAGKTREDSVFSLRHHSSTATARAHCACPPLAAAFVHKALDDHTFDMQIVPVTILWGRSPDRHPPAFKSHFPGIAQYTGRTDRLLTILLHGRNVLVRFGEPISLRRIVDETPDETRAMRKLARRLRIHFRQQRAMATCPALPHRDTQIAALLRSPTVLTAIDREAAQCGISPDEARQRARCFAREIAADYSYGALRTLKPGFSWLWTHLYDSVEIYNIGNIARIAPQYRIVYIPAHRSHIDYLVLSYFLHQHGLAPPHIAAGANLNMPLVGSVLRRCGAFFLRRSFKGEALYTAIFNEYLHRLLIRGCPLEYFIEGGRSRSGRTLSPKMGLLGMTIASFLRERHRPLAFIPVYLGYEKLIEGNTYLRELAGQPKKKESIWTLLQSICKIRRIYGRVHVNFGEPMDLGAFLDAQRPGWRNASPGDWSREVTRQAATTLATRLNAAAVITPTGLIALTLLSMPQHAATEQRLHDMLAHYQALAAEAPYAPQVIACPLSPPQIVAYVLRLGSIERTEHPCGSLIRIPDGGAPLLAYFRDNIIHLFALPALIAHLVNRNRRLSTGGLLAAVSGIYDLMRAELFLRWPIEEMPAVTERIIAVLHRRGLLQYDTDGFLCAPVPNTQASEELAALGEILRGDLERHCLVLALLRQSGNGRRTRPQLEEEYHRECCRLAPQPARRRTTAPSASARGDVSAKAAIDCLIAAGLLREDEAGLLHLERFDAHLDTLLAQMDPRLPQTAEHVSHGMENMADTA